VLHTLTGEVNGEHIALEVDMTNVYEVERTVNTVLQLFHKHWGTPDPFAFSPRTEWLLSNIIRTLIVVPDVKLGDLPRLLTDTSFREPYKQAVTNPMVLQNWAFYEEVENSHEPPSIWQTFESVTTRVSQLVTSSF
jgi:hypothetical protein